jgi:peptidyl-prolyl cis-trans isomerase C
VNRYSTLLLLITIAGCERAPAEISTTAQAASGVVETAQSGQAPGGATAAAPAVKPVPAELPEVLARVNGEEIHKEEFERALEGVIARAGQPVPPERRDEIYRSILDQLVAVHVLEQESRAKKIEVPEGEIEMHLGEVRKQFQSEEEFKQALASRHTTVEALKAEARREMAVAKLVEAEVGPQINVQEQDVKAFYDGNPERFQQPEGVRASHILLRVEPGASDTQKQAAKDKASGLLKELQGGADFAALAKQHSQDGSGPNGGDLSFFVRGQMVPPFEQAAFALQPGQVSDVVETEFGYHIIKVTERRAARTIPLSEAAPRIAQFLVMQQQQEKTEELISRLRAKSKIEILI